MKKPIQFISVFVLVFFSIIIGVYAYYGGFRKISFEITETGGEVFVYADVRGSYRQSPAYMDSVYYYLLDEFRIQTTKAMGIYWDNPNQVEEKRTTFSDRMFTQSTSGQHFTFPNF